MVITAAFPAKSTRNPLRKALGKAFLLTPFLLAACQQATPPTAPPSNERPSVTLIAKPDIGEAPLTVTLTAQGTDPDGDTLSYRWNIVGGETEPESFEGEAVQTRTFETPGEYLIEVVASDGDFDSEPDAATVIVQDPDAPTG